MRGWSLGAPPETHLLQQPHQQPRDTYVGLQVHPNQVAPVSQNHAKGWVPTRCPQSLTATLKGWVPTRWRQSLTAVLKGSLFASLFACCRASSHMLAAVTTLQHQPEHIAAAVTALTCKHLPLRPGALLRPPRRTCPLPKNNMVCRCSGTTPGMRSAARIAATVMAAVHSISSL